MGPSFWGKPSVNFLSTICLHSARRKIVCRALLYSEKGSYLFADFYQIAETLVNKLLKVFTAGIQCRFNIYP